VALRRLDDALTAGDTIHAVIRASAINNDGATKVSYLAPSVDGQAKAIAEALSLADVDPASIGLVEGHGTATPVGDPIEVAALTQAFRTRTDGVAFCALGSIKSNIGHLDTAAGVASFAKAVLALKHRIIPPTVHFEAPNPLLELESSPFFVNGEALPWTAGPEPRRAGVNSLGVGGTNAHVILEEAPATAPSPPPSRPWHLLPLSARSRGALDDASRALLEHLEGSDETGIADLSYTLRVGRRAFAHRRALVCRTRDEAIETLATGHGPGWVTAEAPSRERGVAFLFAGGGAQYPGMARELYEGEPTFRADVDRCLAILDGQIDVDLRSILLPEAGADLDALASELQRPSRALPALFTIQYAQARLWMSWGVEPTSMIGHSMGEYTAACLAGVFSLEDALSVVCLRGRLFESVDAGGMLSVGLGEEALRAHLGDALSIAAVNAPEVTVAAGPVDAIERLHRTLEENEVECRRIRIDVAAHSAMLDGVLDPFGAHLRTLRLQPPSRPFVSNLSGTVAGDEVASADYWVRHLRETVRFAHGIGELLGEDGPLLVEVGPGRTLATLARLHPEWTPAQASLTSLPGPKDDDDDAQGHMIGTLGAIWAHGGAVDWGGFDAGEVRRRIPAPLYPFQRKPYFVAPPQPHDVSSTEEFAEGDRIEDLARWVHQRVWQPLPPPLPRPGALEDGVLVLVDGGAAGQDLVARLEAAGTSPVVVRVGPAFEVGTDGVAVRPDHHDDWVRLWSWLATDEGGGLPGTVVHAWCLTASGDADASPASREARAFWAPVHMVRALEELHPGHELQWVTIASGSLAASPGEGSPEHALLQGPTRVVPREIPTISTRLIDPGVLPEQPAARRAIVSRLVDELRGSDPRVRIGYRGLERLEPSFIPVPLDDPGPIDGLADHATVLITGGLGGIALSLARSMAERRPLRFVLLGRAGLPPRDQWSDWAARHPDDVKTGRAIREVRAIEALGSTVDVRAADVTDTAAMTRLVSDVREASGGLDAVVHAAGVLDDGPLLGREADRMRAVLGAKVAGARALDAAVGDTPLEFFVVFSSVSAVLGAAGQTDYAAANAFLDAFARDRERRTGQRTVSVGWGAWRDVGMAAELAGRASYGGGDDEADRGDPLD
ncbi:MAG: SDR family NAD(P)-dependent oxidoreductase, partial [Gemmatimonadetes bacterium]|nr:SDR family NAD(P)-dependent oxidoreductase [Gemmatimonadota bacterium]